MKDVEIKMNEIDKFREMNFEDFSMFDLLKIQNGKKNVCMVFPYNVLKYLEKAEDVKVYEGIRYCAEFDTRMGFNSPRGVIAKSYDYDLLLRVLKLILNQ